MVRWWTVALAGILMWHGAGATARAQFPLGGYTPPQIQSRPSFSPYLNLNRPGTLPGINYYGLVRPQQQTAQQIQNLQNQQNAMAQPADLGGGIVQPGQPVPQSTTGHPVFYFDYSRYFPLQGLPNFGGAGIGGAGYGGAGFGGNPFNRTVGTPGFGIVVR
jgi:hypothetical protein